MATNSLQAAFSGSLKYMYQVKIMAMAIVMKLNRQQILLVAITAWVGLIIISLGWELWWAPLRPGGSWLALKALPLC